MAANEARLRELLEALAPDVPAAGVWPANGNVTVEFLVHLAYKATVPPTAEELGGVLRLCRKVDIAKAVRTRYDAEWNRPTDSELIALAAWPLLVCVFLRHAIAVRSSEPDGKGLSLKLINAAFNALDLYRENDGTHWIDEISGLGEALLDESLAP